MKTRTSPRSVSILNRWVDAYAREHDLPPVRVRNWVSFMVLGGALEQAGFRGTGRRFTVKGGVALELRLRHLARATKDLDLILVDAACDPVSELERALAETYQGFSFRRKGEPALMPNGTARVNIALSYAGKPWGTVQVDVAADESDGAQVEMVDAISLAPFGLDAPESLPCLSLPFHIAHKIHAATLLPADGRRNERFRDVVDLLLLRPWITDFEAVRRACVDVFARRATHTWPPDLVVPEHWAGPFARMAGDLKLETTDVDQAAAMLRELIGCVAGEMPAGGGENDTHSEHET